MDKAVQAAVRRRKSRKAPAEGMEVFLRYLELYLKGKPNRKASTMALLRCSTSTAAALTNRRTPYTRRAKRVWVDILCAAVGKPVGRIIPTTDVTLPEIMVGWVHEPAGKSALRYAADMALGVMLRAKDFALYGSFTLHQDGLLPQKIELMLSPIPHMAVLGKEYTPHRIVLIIGESRDCMQMIYVKHDGEVVCRVDATRSNLDNILSIIYATTKPLTKNFAPRKS